MIAGSASAFSGGTDVIEHLLTFLLGIFICDRVDAPWLVFRLLLCCLLLGKFASGQREVGLFGEDVEEEASGIEILPTDESETSALQGELVCAAPHFGSARAANFFSSFFFC